MNDGREATRPDQPEGIRARPPAAPEGVRLTDARIEALWEATFDKPLPLPDKSMMRAALRRRLFARAIESALAAAEQTDT